MVDGRAAETPPDRADLEHELALLEREQQLLTTKETLAAVQYKIAKLKWQLGLIGDADLASAEEFYESFCYEADR